MSWGSLMLSPKPAHPWPVAPRTGVSWQRETEGKGLMTAWAAWDVCHLPLPYILSCHLHEALLDCKLLHTRFWKAIYSSCALTGLLSRNSSNIL